MAVWHEIRETEMSRIFQSINSRTKRDCLKGRESSTEKSNEF